MNGKNLNGPNEDELIVRATAAYLRRCRRNGHMEDQPSAAMSEYRDGVVTLRNVNGTLAAYALAKDGRLKRVARRTLKESPVC